jgi:signal transduction histidine kinase
MADQKQITVEVVPPPSNLVISGDLGRLRQVLFNLLSNAVKFTPAGGRVRVAAQAVGSFTHVSVEDTGIGIAKQDQERIFEEFQQVDSSASREFQGTGLGLALSRRLIQLHGGTLMVRSEPGKGSVFTFLLPVADVERTAA